MAGKRFPNHKVSQNLLLGVYNNGRLLAGTWHLALCPKHSTHTDPASTALKEALPFSFSFYTRGSRKKVTRLSGRPDYLNPGHLITLSSM